GGAIDAALGSISIGHTLGIANPVLILVGVAVVGVWLLRTRIGLEIRAVGADPGAARLAGIRINRALIVTYAFSSFCAVLAGIVLSAQSLSGDPTVGDKYLLLSVAAPVIGGTSLFGGVATAAGTIVGA